MHGKFWSLDHRIVEVGRDLWRSSSANTCPKEGQPELVAQGIISQILNICKDGDPLTLSEQPVPTFDRLHRKQRGFLMFEWNFQYFSLCPSPLVLSLGTTENSRLYSLPSGIYTHWLSPPSPLFSRLNSPSSQCIFIQQVPQSINQLHGSLLIFINVRDLCVAKLETS